MEKARRGGESIYKNRLMSSNDHARNWSLREREMRENALMQGGRQLKQGWKERRSHVNEFLNNKESRKISKLRWEKQEEKLRLELLKKGLINLELKPLMSSKTAREPNYEAQSGMKKFHKPSEKSKPKEMTFDREASWPKKKLPNLHNTWEYTNYSVVPILSSNRTRDFSKKERKKIYSVRIKKKNESVQSSESVENSKNMKIIWGGNERDKKVEFLYQPFRNFVADRSNYMNETGGEAVVIYQRHNEGNYLHPQTGDGYQFEQISFSGSCETTVDLVHSKRSLSEPRQNSTKELYKGKRRTRFQLEPCKRTSTQSSDFRSVMDFLKQSNGSVEFKNFEEMDNSVTRFICKVPPQDCQKWEEKKNARYSSQSVVKKSKSNSDSSAIIRARLKQTAEKKLDLHKEMIRAEEMSKKKFWESIEKSLNYRCAIAEMFSSQSYLSSNESSKFFGNKENSVGKSTNIYLRESVIKKISSYQGFNGFFTSNEGDFKNKSSTSSNSTYSQMKTVLDTFLIKEDDEIFLKRHLKESFTSRTFSDNIGQTDFMPYDYNSSLSFSTSEMLTLMENNLCNSDTHSKLELLMSKLSEEIRKCSNFIRVYNDSRLEKIAKSSLSKLSLSDTRIKLNKKDENKASKKTSLSWMYPDQLLCPLFYSASLTSLNLTDDHCCQRQKTDLNAHAHSEHDVSSLEPTIMKNFEDPVKTESNQSLFSYKNRSAPSINATEFSYSAEKLHNNAKEFPCCDDCRLLKKQIIKLEKELRKIEKRMPLYPKEYQESIKNCLQSLNGTSETFLKRLNSCAKLKYLDSKLRKLCKHDSKRSMSAPGPIVEKPVKKKLSTMPSNSDYQLNVGMELTMENVDPLPEKKLCSEVKKDTKKEGKIQYKMLKDGEKPNLLTETDFSCNRTTGMFFENKKSRSTENTSPDFIIPVDSVIQKALSALDLVETYENPLQAYECQDIDFKSLKTELTRSKTPKKSLRIASTRGSSCPITDVEIASDMLSNAESKSKEYTVTYMSEVGTSPKSKQSLDVSDSNETRPESQESKKRMKISWFNWKKNEKAKKSISRIPVRKKTTFNSANSRTDSMSFKSSLMSFDVLLPASEYYLSQSDTSKNFLKLAKLFSFTWTFGFFLCKLVYYMQSVSAICSVLTLTAMSLERYYAIVYPMRAQYICTISQARRIITAIWISAFLLAVPILFAQVHLKVGVKVEAYWCVRDWDNKIIWRAHELYMLLLILVVPTVVMAIAYTAICLEIWEVIQRRQDMTSGKGHGFCRKPRLPKASSNDSFPLSVYTNNMPLDSKRRSRRLCKKEIADDGASVKQVIKMLVAVVIIYVICWGPMLIDNVLQAYGILSHIRIGWTKYMGTTFHLMAYFNSCINPIIYGFMSKNFRESFRKTLCCGRKKPKTAYRSFSLSQTRNTSIRCAESSFNRTISIALPV